MSDANENLQTGHVSAIVILTLSIFVLLATVPTVLLLMWLRVVNPEYFRRAVCQEATLPTAEPSPDNKPQGNPFFRRVRAAVSKLRGVAVAAGGAIALRSREVFEKVRGRAARLFGGRSRRHSDLPIMHQKSWQMLAESHTELWGTVPTPKHGEVEHKDMVEQKDGEAEHKAVENPKKSTKTVRFDIGDEVEKETSIQIPQPAVVADEKA